MATKTKIKKVYVAGHNVPAHYVPAHTRNIRVKVKHPKKK